MIAAFVPNITNTKCLDTEAQHMLTVQASEALSYRLSQLSLHARSSSGPPKRGLFHCQLVIGAPSGGMEIAGFQVGSRLCEYEHEFIYYRLFYIVGKVHQIDRVFRCSRPLMDAAP